MLRINLLPSYVAQRRLNKKLGAGFVFGFAVVVGLLLAFQLFYLLPQKNAETKLADDAVAAHNVITSLGSQASAITATVAPIQAKITFFNAVQAYNLEYVKLYEMVARFTSPKILVYGMQVAGSTLTINAYTPSIEDLGRYVQYMYHEPDISSVSISAIPTPDQAKETIYTYKGAVIGVSGGPGSAGTGGGGPTGGRQMSQMAPRQPGGPGMGGMGQPQGMSGGSQASNIPGVPPGVSVSLPAGVTLPAGPTPAGQGGNYGQNQYNQASPSGLPPMMPNAQQSQFGQPGGPRQPGAQGGMGGGAGSSVYELLMADPTFNPKYFKVSYKRTDGFVFVATCALKTTFTPPVPPGSSGGMSTSYSTQGAMTGGMNASSAGFRPPGPTPPRSNSSQ